MLNLKINSTFHIGVKDSQTRAFINDKDIHPKTGRLGIRVYKSDGNCFQKLWILIQSLFGRTLTIIDGSGKEILFSKNSLKNWLEFHGKKVSSYDDQLAKIIDGIFAEQNPKAASEPLNTKKQEVISKQQQTETVNHCTADSGVKNLERKETVAQEKHESEKPKESEKAKETLRENEKAYFISNKEARLKRLNEIVEEFREKAEKYEAEIQKEKERIKSRLDNLKAIKISSEATLSDLPDLTLENELNPLRLSYQWAALKYPQLEAAKVYEREINKINDADPETTPDLIGLLSGIPEMPKELGTEDIKSLFNAEHADVCEYLKETAQTIDDLEKKIGNVITREPLDKKFEFLRNNKQHALKVSVYDNLYEILDNNDEHNEEIKNFLIEMLNKGDTSDSLYQDYFDLLIDILGSQGLLEEDFRKILNESLREEIKQRLSNN